MLTEAQPAWPRPCRRRWPPSRPLLPGGQHCPLLLSEVCGLRPAGSGLCWLCRGPHPQHLGTDEAWGGDRGPAPLSAFAFCPLQTGIRPANSICPGESGTRLPGSIWDSLPVLQPWGTQGPVHRGKPDPSQPINPRHLRSPSWPEVLGVEATPRPGTESGTAAHLGFTLPLGGRWGGGVQRGGLQHAAMQKGGCVQREASPTCLNSLPLPLCSLASGKPHLIAAIISRDGGHAVGVCVCVCVCVCVYEKGERRRERWGEREREEKMEVGERQGERQGWGPDRACLSHLSTHGQTGERCSLRPPIGRGRASSR